MKGMEPLGVTGQLLQILQNFESCAALAVFHIGFGHWALLKDGSVGKIRVTVGDCLNGLN